MNMFFVISVMHIELGSLPMPILLTGKESPTSYSHAPSFSNPDFSRSLCLGVVSRSRLIKNLSGAHILGCYFVLFMANKNYRRFNKL